MITQPDVNKADEKWHEKCKENNKISYVAGICAKMLESVEAIMKLSPACRIMPFLRGRYH